MKLITAATIFLAATSAYAADLPMPTGETVLTVSGNVPQMNDGDKAVFDIEMLQALPQTTYTTTTIWTEGTHEFTGVLLSDLLAAVGSEPALVNATAINDYAVEIPPEDAIPGGALVAYLFDGEQMSIRDKGPLWVVYNWDQDPTYKTEVVYSRSIWQFDRIEVKE